jgi:formamidopyrimidine-DNA glycosylase
VPELPDLTVVADALHSALAGRRIRSATAPGPLAVRGTPSELEALASQRVESIRRRGKFLLIRLERDEIAANPMLTGRFQLAAPGDKLPAKTAVVLAFGPREGGPDDAAAWTSGAKWLPADDARPEVRYRDPTQMGKIYLRPAGVDRAASRSRSCPDTVTRIPTWHVRRTATSSRACSPT